MGQDFAAFAQIVCVVYSKWVKNDTDVDFSNELISKMPSNIFVGFD